MKTKLALALAVAVSLLMVRILAAQDLGPPGTAKILEDMEKYYTLLVERVGAMVKARKSLDEIKKDLRMPETDDWAGKDRFPNNIEAAYRAVAK